jgi:hypothetical protein
MLKTIQFTEQRVKKKDAGPSEWKYVYLLFLEMFPELPGSQEVEQTKETGLTALSWNCTPLYINPLTSFQTILFSG